jgi:predicted Zn-dependent protease with MMP-like domain/Flp pilus assembly protein TadD
MTKRNDESTAAMDALSAHLDRGWEALQENDHEAARISARAALKDQPSSPEATTLLGACAAADGDIEEAMARFREAMTADPEYVAPRLYLAELHLDAGEEDDLEEALQLTDEALDLAEEEEDYLDALLLKTEALLALDRPDEAKESLDELPQVTLPEATYHMRAARCCLDLDLLDQAEAHYRKAGELEPKSPDVFHGLGLVHEAREDHRAMIKSWLRVRELDMEEAKLPWTLTQEEFEAVAEEALEELPEQIQKLLENVPIVAADYPSIEMVAEGNDPRILGFFSGVPYPEKSSVGGTPHLDCVFLYKDNIERISRNRDEVRREIRTTLLHETGHFFGLSEEELDEMGLG